ncbi:MAG: DUF6448 family protein [Balneolaceae bacterium]
MKTNRHTLRNLLSVTLLAFFMLFNATPASAHCDSYDGPVIVDAVKALNTNNVNLVLKWINADQEAEIIALFNKTYKLKKGDKEVYDIVEKHFFETLVRLHRETENAPFTGLFPAGSTKMIVQLSDHAVESKDIESLLTRLNDHINNVIREKYELVAALDLVKDTSVEKGREYVAAYVEYTHILEAMHDIIEHGVEHGH